MRNAKQIITTCPQCNKKTLNDFTGVQKLPARRDNCVWIKDGQVVYDEVELWTCKKCQSTWVNVK